MKIFIFAHVMKNVVSKYLLMLLLLLSSCMGRMSEYPPLLVRAEQVMETNPDSALIYLDSLALQYDELAEEAKMYHALLTVKAKDKLYIPAASDSLINRVVAFYEEANNPHRLVEAYYLQGGTYRDLEDAPRAIAAYQRAADLGKVYANDTLNGRIYGQMATVFAYQSLYDASMEATRQAYRYHEKCLNYSGMAYSLRNIGRIHDRWSRKDSAEIYYRKAYTLLYNRVSSETASGIGDEFAGVLLNYGEVDSAKVWIDRAHRIQTSDFTSLILAKIYHRLNQFDSAMYHCHKVIQGGNIRHQRSAYKVMADIAESRKDYQKAYLYAAQCVEALDSIAYVTRSEAVKKTYSLYNYNIAESKNRELEGKVEQRNILLFQLGMLVLGLSSVVTLLIYYFHKRRRYYAEREAFLKGILHERQLYSEERIAENLKQIAELDKQLRSVTAENDGLKRSILEAQAQALKGANEQLIATRREQEYKVQMFQLSDIYLHFHRAKSSSELSKEDWNRLADAINEAYPDFTKRLYILYPRLSELELHICYLAKIEITRGRISELLNRAPSTITNAFSRLYQKIHGEKGNPQQMVDIILAI